MSRGQTGAGHSCAALPADIDPQNSVRCSPLAGPRAAIVTLSGIRLAAGGREGGGSGLRASSSLTLLFFGWMGVGVLGRGDWHVHFLHSVLEIICLEPVQFLYVCRIVPFSSLILIHLDLLSVSFG